MWAGGEEARGLEPFADECRQLLGTGGPDYPPPRRTRPSRSSAAAAAAGVGRQSTAAAKVWVVVTVRRRLGRVRSQIVLVCCGSHFVGSRGRSTRKPGGRRTQRPPRPISGRCVLLIPAPVRVGPPPRVLRPRAFEGKFAHAPSHVAVPPPPWTRTSPRAVPACCGHRRRAVLGNPWPLWPADRFRWAARHRPDQRHGRDGRGAAPTVSTTRYVRPSERNR